MDVKVTRHFNYQTPLDEAQNEQELAKIFRLKWPKAKNLMLSDCRFFADMIEQARKYKAWKVIGFNSLEEFIKAELDTSLAEVESIIAGVKIAREGGESGPISKADAISRARENADSVQGKRTDKLNGNSIKCEQGTTNGNILRRLAREGKEELLTAIESGDLSVNAAAIKAGYRKKPTTVEVIRKAWVKLTESERDELLKWMTTNLKGTT